ncbi:MAG: prepilin-type N-terminal cleavage/methylation domain-containing protein [Mollicutes bacterium]|nr:prepilin-type N-terminal cleavage/methylation domain-containing protein [Mollicutes bacterium]
MNEKNRGFTLIEMLAVIVVLALIMVIAVPLVLKTIEGVKQGAFKNSAYAMVKAAELEYAKQVL